MYCNSDSREYLKNFPFFLVDSTKKTLSGAISGLDIQCKHAMTIVQCLILIHANYVTTCTYVSSFSGSPPFCVYF